MKQKNKISFFFVTLLLGLMLAIQYQSTNENENLDTKDMWELRERYIEAKDYEAKLIQEIRTIDEKIAEYKKVVEHSKGTVLKQTLEELQTEAGLTELSGPGIIITIQPETSFFPIDSAPTGYVSPDLIRKLINELNMYGAKAISVANQRIINTTSIRDVQGETKIDGFPLRTFPIEIKVIAEDEKTANKLYNGVQISTIPDDFFIDNLSVSISEVKKSITIPAYNHSIKVDVMETVKDEGEQ
ncbi:DUF881 domain-containing protein [Fervidibacillus halotolerans]|uniref:DUF881 domain-containing protein n=1 Tax=Fervidibacillus halotolerans TaxID=2980027 RepID=A0A9E8M194_9BACI|nr:DUF881 domain-containing protein [Fervidibacillus halotolerans]WAA13678.1 DUF881 domain-containing protein [Fervidibacillus halotolerans]